MMEQEVEDTRVFVTIDDLIDEQRLVELLEDDLGREPSREQELALANACAEYDEDRHGFVLKTEFLYGDNSIDAWEAALASAEEEGD